MKILYLIPARGGSKGVLKKNIKLLKGKPLIQYSLEAAIEVSSKNDICISTDSVEIKNIVEDLGVSVPFLRPNSISTDYASSEDVMLHALNYYKNKGLEYDYLVMLQPTSPLRTANHIKKALELVDSNTELLVSVKETDTNPYYVLFEESENGILEKTKKGTFTRRQDCPVVYELNGAIYVIKVSKLLEKGYQNLKMSKFVMSKESSVDIDDDIDFKLAELLIKTKLD